MPVKVESIGVLFVDHMQPLLGAISEKLRRATGFGLRVDSMQTQRSLSELDEYIIIRIRVTRAPSDET